VNGELLDGSSVKYAATATIGVDHIDLTYLEKSGIAFASAPGSNATSVSEWVTAAVLTVATRDNISLAGKTLGIVGVGNVGSRVQKKGEALGMKVILNDPPRARKEGDDKFTGLDELLAQSDFVTVHVPLTKDGEDATLRLAGESFFSKMKKGAVFLNSSRGAVVEETSLLAALESGQISTALLDVWEHEPSISHQTLAKTLIATPHIAGYSFDGKVAGTRMIQHAAVEALGAGEKWNPAPLLPEAEVPFIQIDCAGKADEEIMQEAVSAVYPIMEDDTRMRKALDMAEAETGPYFTKLRKEYPRRREFEHTTVELLNAGVGIKEKLAGLGFATR
ncbi:MAG: 4-phosphoerythronate dehydrogenase, partial [Planctomycetes bacterium]|nr:4-phosphoerythronate dehydrogenase [Planctomycetota bacterium]